MAEVNEKAKPFFYKANLGSQGLAILIHGFTGSIYDLREIGEFLAQNGIDACGIRLAGHGSCPEDLAQTCPGDWWHSVEREIRKRQNKYKKIHLIGYSFGANLAVDFAVRYPKLVKSVVLLGPSVFIRLDKLVRFLLPIKKIYKKYYHKKFSSRAEQLEYEADGSYSKIPLKSIKDFFNFIDDYTKKEIPCLNVPTLIIQSAKDRTVHPRSAHYVHERMKHPNRELLMLDDHEHNPFFSNGREQVFEKVLNFIKHT